MFIWMIMVVLHERFIIMVSLSGLLISRILGVKFDNIC